jgi:hypothetical protein
MLAEKDAAGFLEALAPALAAAVCTELPADRLRAAGRPGSTSRPAAELAALASERGLEAMAVSGAGAALARCRDLARQRDGVALATGSHYLLDAARRAWERT